MTLRIIEISRRMAKLVLFTAVIIAIFSCVASVDEKCAACTAVAEELELQLLKEKPRNHLDMRNRLNSKGQYEGKVIDYRYNIESLTLRRWVMLWTLRRRTRGGMRLE